MIFSSFHAPDDLGTYPEAIRKALEYLRDHDIDATEPGRYPIDGDRMFAVVTELTTRPVEEIPPEIHGKYIDVQYWQSGRERFGIAPRTEADRITEAKEASDVWYLEPAEPESFVTTGPGCFAVFFPWDVHRPGCMLDQPETFHKCVVKVSMDLL